MSKNTSSGSKIGVVDLLAVAFIVLKVANVIDWSWFWVLSPWIIQLGVNLILIVIFVIVKWIDSR